MLRVGVELRVLLEWCARAWVEHVRRHWERWPAREWIRLRGGRGGGSLLMLQVELLLLLSCGDVEVRRTALRCGKLHLHGVRGGKSALHGGERLGAVFKEERESRGTSKREGTPIRMLKSISR